MSGAYRLTRAGFRSSWVRTPNGQLLGRVDHIGDKWVAALANPEPMGSMLGEDLPGEFGSRFAAAEALLRHYEGQP